MISFLKNVLCVLYFCLLSTQCLFGFPSLLDEIYLYHSGSLLMLSSVIYFTIHMPVLQEAWDYGAIMMNIFIGVLLRDWSGLLHGKVNIIQFLRGLCERA